MPKCGRHVGCLDRRITFVISLALFLSCTLVQTTPAVLTGGDGNQPLRDPGWPAGAAAVFNHPGRIAWWEELLFPGEWHAEYRGDVKELNALLAQFAKIDVKSRQLVV